MNNRKRQNGFTLIEYILVIVVMGTLAFVTVPIIESGIENWSFVKYRSELWQSGELAFSRMGTEIREIRGTSDVITADAQNLRFITVSGDDITYSLSGGTLNRNGNTLLTGINAFSFSYFDSNIGEIASPQVSPTVTDIRLVRMYVVLGPTGRTFTLQTDIHPRNLE